MSGRPKREPLMMIAAMTPSRVIGKDNALPWRYPEDQKHFQRETRGHAVIMGRATFESLPAPLKNRRNIVVSRNPALRIEGAEVVDSLERAIALAREHDPEPVIAGGAQLYALALPLATKMLLTYLDQEYEGDAYFPAIEPTEWREVERRRSEGLTFVTLERGDS